MKKQILRRLKEPTTYIAVGLLLQMIGVPVAGINEAVQVATGACAALGIALPEVSK
jgi:hypothetical protein